MRTGTNSLALTVRTDPSWGSSKVTGARRQEPIIGLKTADGPSGAAASAAAQQGSSSSSSSVPLTAAVEADLGIEDGTHGAVDWALKLV